MPTVLLPLEVVVEEFQQLLLILRRVEVEPFVRVVHSQPLLFRSNFSETIKRAMGMRSVGVARDDIGGNLDAFQPGFLVSPIGTHHLLFNNHARLIFDVPFACKGLDDCLGECRSWNAAAVTGVTEMVAEAFPGGDRG
ncbi:hypothetical protein D3C84_717450 [compost metagenome]